MKNTLLLFFTFLSISCFAQFSKTHYIPPVTAQNNLVGDHYLYISTPSTTSVNFRIIENGNGGAVITGTVSNTAPYVYRIGTGNTTQLFTPKTEIGTVQNKGYVIEAENLIYASVRVNSGLTFSGNYNHAGGLVSKGNSALGKVFRLGAMLNPLYDTSLLNFASILSTENNTAITISNIPDGTVLSNGIIVSGPISITLNKNESYVLALENYPTSTSNSSKMIGALVLSDKPVVVNSGSFGGSNNTILTGTSPMGTGRDVGFDQIVPLEKTGKTYIFVEGNGTDELERVILVSHSDNTEIFTNGNPIPVTTLTAGSYHVLNGNDFINGNLYVTTSENVFAYQCIGGTASPANQNLFFVPPLNCSTPNIVDNIPLIQAIGAVTYNGGLNIVTEANASVLINNLPISASAVPIIGPTAPSFVRYTVNNLSGNIAVTSSKQVYVSYFGTNGAATYGGYYSGFDIKPEITFSSITSTSTGCMPNVELSITSDPLNNRFQWVYNGQDIPGAISNTYTPSLSEKGPGYYKVKKFIISCGTETPSDEIPVSDCPIDTDNDGINNNTDIDNDNDGITNCTESYGDKSIPVSSSSSSIAIGNYSNPYIESSIISGIGANTFTGSAGDSFTTNLAAGITNAVTYKLDFDNPISLGLKYNPNSTATASSLSNEEFVIKSDVNKTITVLNPSNQLLIDTNYDGIYESGVTVYSSFEVRFRLNGTILVPASGSTPPVDFKFQTYLSKSISFTHQNLSDSDTNNASFSFYAICVPRDSDSDGITDDLDLDSDNDGIPDTFEAQGSNVFIAYSTIDANKDGLGDTFGIGLNPIDKDNDGVKDYLDLDSDNDGIYDLVESGSNAPDAALDGIIDGSTFGANGLADSLETSPESGVLNYTIRDTDSDGIKNYLELDSDNDLCFDTVEAGFLDPDNDGFLGNSPLSIDVLNGKITSAAGYSIPNNNYITAAPIVIATQPIVTPTCELQDATITVVDNGGNTYQWQLSTNGSTWSSIINNATYSGATTKTLLITSVKNVMSGHKYRVQLNKVGNSCGLLSSDTMLTVYTLPIVANVTIIQCDDDLDAITTFNLNVKNSAISSNASDEFTYYTSFSGATTANLAELITTPLAFTNTTPSTMKVWARVLNTNGCFSVAELTLKVLATQIPNTFKRTYTECDDFLDGNGNNNSNNDKRDGVSSFNFSSAATAIKALLPVGNYTVTFYRNQADALSQLNVITDITNYRNIGYPNTQQIWGRVDSDVDNACYGLGPYVSLTVEKLPLANTVTIPRQCDDNQDGIYTFNTATLQSTLLNGQNNVTVSYFDVLNNPLKDSNGVLISSPFPATFTTTSQTIRAIVTTNSSLKCYDETLIVFTVDDLPEAFPIPTSLTTVCDDEPNPLLQDGKFSFDTSTFEATILKGQIGMIITYFDQNGNLLSQLPNPFVTATQNIKVTVENTVNTTCKASLIIPFIVHPLPNINLNTNGNENELVCSNLPTFFVTLDAGIQDGSLTSAYNYIWSKDGVALGSNPTLDVNTEGNYSVEVSTLKGCSRIRTIKVTTSENAKLSSIEIVDLADTNTVTVNVTGRGSYEYSLDEPNGPFQSSNFFDNVPAGIHEVYINDSDGCGTISETIAVLGAPKFFTPNGDGYNDYWNLKGANKDFNSKSIIFIFNRYGKLLKKINPYDKGWDGTFNGLTLPSDDYWFTIKLEDGRETKGHFSLKR